MVTRINQHQNRPLILSIILSTLVLSSCTLTNPFDQEAENLKLANQDLPANTSPGAIRQKKDVLVPPTPSSNPPSTPDQQSQIADYPKKITQASQTLTLQTSKGVITIQTLPDKAPNTVQNFMTKVKASEYQNRTFHRVEDWLIQGGDPNSDGSGGGTIPTETNDLPFEPGSVGMARGADKAVSNDAQFFICTKDCSWLAGQYTQFATVTEGLDIAQQIQPGDTIQNISIRN